jgi:hypothetical protein
MTDAPGITAPVVSVTTPLMDDEEVCATQAQARIKQKKMERSTKWFVIPSPTKLIS